MNHYRWVYSLHLPQLGASCHSPMTASRSLNPGRWPGYSPPASVLISAFQGSKLYQIEYKVLSLEFEVISWPTCLWLPRMLFRPVCLLMCTVFLIISTSLPFCFSPQRLVKDESVPEDFQTNPGSSSYCFTPFPHTVWMFFGFLFFPYLRFIFWLLQVYEFCLEKEQKFLWASECVFLSVSP